MGAQESVMRAAIADMVPVNRLGLAYGVLNTFYGFFWFGGSILMGGIVRFLSGNSHCVFCGDSARFRSNADTGKDPTSIRKDGKWGQKTRIKGYRFLLLEQVPGPFQAGVIRYSDITR